MMEKLREKINREMRSGIYTLFILKTVDDLGKSYGYEIVKHIEKLTDGNISLKDATVYPILRYLTKKKILRSFWTEPSLGVPRKYYHLTPEGKKLLHKLISDYRELEKYAKRILGGDSQC